MSTAQCPFHSLRKELPPLPPRLGKLPVDERGYPVPFFVAYVDGRPEFRMADADKFKRCVKERLCWVCGQTMGRFVTFAIGPMCAVTGTTSDPGMHLDCAQWSVKGCPFLVKPQMVRREDELTRSNKGNVAGIMIDRNPGVTCLWTTRNHSFFPDQNRKLLINVGQAESVSWWREGRPATRAEVKESITSGLPLLMQYCHSADDLDDLRVRQKQLNHWLPQ